MESDDHTSSQAQGTRAFISYSREDQPLVNKLSQALERHGHIADFDQSTHDPHNIDTGIAATDEWWLRLQDMIAASDVTILIVSPDSAASKIVDEEIAYAQAIGKRVFPVLARELDFRTAPPRLSALNVQTWFLDLPFDEAVERLSSSISVDVEWLREARRLTIRAKEWNDHQRVDDKLLIGREISAAEVWVVQKPADEASVSAFLTDYIAASRLHQEAEDEDERRKLRRQRQLQRRVTFLLFGAFILITVFGVFVLDNQRRVAREKSSLLANLARQTTDLNTDHSRALRLATIAAKDTFLSPASVEARAILARAAIHSLQTYDWEHPDARVATVSVTSERALAVVTDSHHVEIWDMKRNERVSEFSHPSNWVYSVVFDSSNQRIATSGDDGSVVVWDTLTGDLLFQLPMQEGQIAELAFNADGDLLATAPSFGTVTVWNLATGVAELVPDQQAGMVSDVRYSDSGDLLLIAEGNSAGIWKAKTGEKVLSLGEHNGNVITVSMSPTSNIAATGSRDSTVKIWNTETGALVKELTGHDGPVYSVAFSLDGAVLLTTSADLDARVWETAAWKEVSLLPGHSDPVTHGTFDYFTSEPVTVSNDGTGGTVKFWQPSSSSVSAVFPEHDDFLSASVASADGRIVFSASHDGSVRVLDSATQTVRYELVPERSGKTAIFDLVRLKDKNVIVTAESSGVARVWDTDARMEIQSFRGHGDARINAVDVSRDGVLTVTGDSDGILHVWNLVTGERVAEYKLETGSISDVALDPLSQKVAFASDYGVLQVWDFERHEITLKLNRDGIPVTAVGYTSDGTRLAVGFQDKQLILLDTVSGDETVSFIGHESAIRSVTFSGDDLLLLSSSSDGTARIWDAQSGVELVSLDHSDEFLVSATFLGDGDQILTTGEFGSLQIWSLNDWVNLPRQNAELVARVCAEKLAGRIAGRSDTVAGIRFINHNDTDYASILSETLGKNVCE